MSDTESLIAMPLSVVDSIYAVVRKEILAGKHAPGTALRQDDIAARLGVSKIPLREAFSRLESEGLLMLRPRRGYSVASFDLDEIDELFQLRAVIEEHVGVIAAQRHDEEDAERVASLAEEMTRLDKAAPDYHGKWCMLNRDFHGAIIEASRKRLVIKIAMQLRDLIEPYIRLDTTMSPFDPAADQEHRQISEAFRARDGRLVGALCAAHCYHTRDRLLQSIRQAAGQTNAPLAAAAAAGAAKRGPGPARTDRRDRWSAAVAGGLTDAG